jgi:hypothetical protein
VGSACVGVCDGDDGPGEGEELVEGGEEVAPCSFVPWDVVCLEMTEVGGVYLDGVG